jgi:hypothetical protein
MKGVDHMDTENKNVELDEQTALFEDETAPNTEPGTTDELKGAIEETLSKIRTQSMLLGAQAMCQTILSKIYAFESSQGKKSTNDYKRCIKDIRQFCETGLSRKVNADGTTEPIEETTQN